MLNIQRQINKTCFFLICETSWIFFFLIIQQMSSPFSYISMHTHEHKNTYKIPVVNFSYANSALTDSMERS